MGKRKSRTKPPPKKRLDKLDMVFNCPFCNHEKTVDCLFDRGNKIAELSCGVCKESYNTSINNLTEAVDVYSEWIDECERANDFEDPA
ncbi:transcription elongation factor 1 [Cinnamomum micranthum f. kanehirae]|uniref:Transcription elongation factor 1 homolog n=1 Tax=Cinnamomum micranthum f. kanehirae TaxID=337451 RepID=A0A443PI70_9MAGN|nr:transcription elongation factor 1 [Cinnamomum micranthum f. kanehirae]